MGIVSALGMLLLMGVMIALPFVASERDNTGEDDV